jgi:radical SAM protein with 4Fe4S-binding SPASM domain
MQVEPGYNTERGEYSDPSRKQAKSFVKNFINAFEVANKFKRHLSYSGARPWLIASSFCKASENAIVVTPEGYLVTCFETHGQRHPLISQFTVGHATPDEIKVDFDALQAFSEQQLQRRGSCEGCFCFWHCCGDCATRCMLSRKKSRERCYVNREITKYLLAFYIASGNGVWNGLVRHQTQGRALVNEEIIKK